MGLFPAVGKGNFCHHPQAARAGHHDSAGRADAKMALAISDRAYVLETGNISIEGNAADLLNDPRVKKAYLGQ